MCGFNRFPLHRSFIAMLSSVLNDVSWAFFGAAKGARQASVHP